MKIGFTTRAVGDLEATLARYGAIDHDLVERFRVDVDTTLERMRMFPHGAPPVEGFPGLRRARMRRFPYGIFYRPGVADLLVVRVLHAKQDQPPALEAAQPESSPIP